MVNKKRKTRHIKLQGTLELFTSSHEYAHGIINIAGQMPLTPLLADNADEAIISAITLLHGYSHSGIKLMKQYPDMTVLSGITGLGKYAHYLLLSIDGSWYISNTLLDSILDRFAVDSFCMMREAL